MSPGTNKFRIYFWHANKYADGTTQIGIRLSAPGGATITSYKRRSYVGKFKDIISKGMCLAENQLYGLLTPITAFNGTIPASGELSFWTATAEQWAQGWDCLVAAVIEIDISPADDVEDSYLNFRSVVSRNGSWGDWGTYDGENDNVAAPGGAPRGWWPYSKIQLTHEGRFNCALVGGDPVWQKGICENADSGEHTANGFDVQTGNNPDGTPKDKYGKKNKGCYGADLRYLLKAKAVGNSGKLYVGLRSRNTPAKNAGAGRLVYPDELAATCVPKFACQETGQPEDYRNYLDVLEYKSGGNFYTLAANEEKDLKFDFAVAGGSATPLNLVMAREDVKETEPEDPGGG